ncbi:MAG: 4Fe-4S binding protein [Defluviitaleaceae bacterium]|nr:4Fe-4S binding protein [Defluviitaleaceae bacterium]
MGSAAKKIIGELAEAGYPAAFAPFGAMERISAHYDKILVENAGVRYVADAVNHFKSNQPPDVPFEPLSLFVAAFPCEFSKISFVLDKKSASIPIPPFYVDDPARRARFDETVKSSLSGYQTAHTKGVSQKLIAVVSGLGRYGRNNICYIDGIGSYFQLKAYYTDAPCGGAPDYPVRFLDSCEGCGLCRSNCPTGAIGENRAIDATRCLTMYNERANPLPDWLPGEIHHALTGCLRCQEVCPANAPLSKMPTRSIALDEAETRAFIGSETGGLPEELNAKLKSFGFEERDMQAFARNAGLALKNIYSRNVSQNGEPKS